jgi:hypothetical protein
VIDILLGLASLVGFFLLGNAERHEMKLPAVMYWLTWIGGGVAGSVYVGTQIEGPAGVFVGVVLAIAFVAAVSWSLGKPVNDAESQKLENAPPRPPSAGS